METQFLKSNKNLTSNSSESKKPTKIEIDNRFQNYLENYIQPLSIDTKLKTDLLNMLASTNYGNKEALVYPEEEPDKEMVELTNNSSNNSTLSNLIHILELMSKEATTVITMYPIMTNIRPEKITSEMTKKFESSTEELKIIPQIITALQAYLNSD